MKGILNRAENSKSDSLAARIVFLSIFACLLAQAWLIFDLEINWDEFSYLSQIYDYQRGEMGKVFQALHVHLLDWITRLPGSEIDQVIAGRFVMLAFLTGTCVSTYQLSRAFFSPTASGIAVLAFASAGSTIIHGASFRSDPIAAFFIMLSLAVMARGEIAWRAMLVSGAAAAIGAMITIKVGLYAPAFAGVAAWRLCVAQDRRKTFKWLAGISITAGISFALIYGVQLFLVENSSNARSQAMLSNAAHVQFLEYGLLPRRAEIIRTAQLSSTQAILLAVGALGVVAALIRGRTGGRCQLIAVAGCGATLACLLLYRNAFPYFFAFILPPAMLLVARVVESSSLLKGRTGVAILATVMLAQAALVTKAWGERERPPQDNVIAAVHQIFPQPVAMIDHSHMIGSFPKRGFFMSTWGMANYRANPPIFANILRRETVPLLLLDSPRLAEAVGARPAMSPSDRLHDEDRGILRNNYVKHWGPIWVAGKRLLPSGSSGWFEILIPGQYTLEGEALVIDGRLVEVGDVIRLERGNHHFEAQSQLPSLLRWGDHLHMPAGPEPSGTLFVGF